MPSSTPTPTYCNWEAVRERVASGLHITASQLANEWASICAESTKDAAAEIKRILILKGYTPDQIAESDDAKVWNERLGAFFAFARGAALANYDLEAVKYLDIREEMKEAGALVINNVATAPALNNSEIGGISSGQLDAVKELLDPNNTGWGVGIDWNW